MNNQYCFYCKKDTNTKKGDCAVCGFSKINVVIRKGGLCGSDVLVVGDTTMHYERVKRDYRYGSFEEWFKRETELCNFKPHEKLLVKSWAREAFNDAREMEDRGDA